MNSRIALSGLSILASLALVTTGAYAAFSSTNSNNGNTFASGTMALSINTQGPPTSSPVFTVTNAVPGVSHSASLELRNQGTVSAGSVQVDHIDLVGDAGLQGDTTLVLFADTNDNGLLDGSETILGNAHLNSGAWTGLTLTGVSIPGDSGASVYHLGAQVTLDTAAPDVDQGKSMTFNLVLKALQ